MSGTESRSTPAAAHTSGGTRPGAASATASRVRLLVFSDDSTVREAVRLAVGRRPARDVEVESWLECATPEAVFSATEAGDIDILVLDGEATPYGGLGLCRDLKHTVYECPPVIVLTGRPQDGWLAAWSYADHAVPHPVDAMTMGEAVAKVARATPQRPADPARHG